MLVFRRFGPEQGAQEKSCDGVAFQCEQIVALLKAVALPAPAQLTRLLEASHRKLAVDAISASVAWRKRFIESKEMLARCPCLTHTALAVDIRLRSSAGGYCLLLCNSVTIARKFG